MESHILPAVAIVGISLELPSGYRSSKNLDFSAFQELLLRGDDVYEKFPRDRVHIQSWSGNGLGQILTDTGAFLKDLSFFDHLEFGISTKDAKAMAVGTRKLLEQSFLALLDSGIDYRGRNVGCYMSAVGYDINTVVEPDEFEARGSFAGAACMVANRISYYLDLLGPSVPVDTACSSSLTATHLAVQAIRNGECEAAVVGGCQVNHRLIDWINYSQGNVLSPDGKCKPFDITANGFGRGEGAVVVVLKLLSDAIRDGDHVYASIIGTGINASGCAAPVSAPVAEAQQDAMLRAYAHTGRFPAEADYIELHATGTAAGDPTEANWVGETFKRDGEILVGSVKGNFGHLEIAAFLVSLAKACTVFCTGTIPQNVNFKIPNPAIKWAEYGLRVVAQSTKINPRHKSGRALISITSSGIGGSNGHAVVEGPPSLQNGTNDIRRSAQHLPVLFVAAGLTPRSASLISESLTNTIAQTPSADMPLLSTVFGRRARQLTWRSFVVIQPSQPPTSVSFSTPTLVPRGKPPIVFLFSGQGPQHVNMGRQLFSSYPVFRETVLILDGIYEHMTGNSLIKTYGLFDASQAPMEILATWPISLALPAIAMVQIALVDLLSSINVVPDIVLGHSAGETAMLYACGAASKEMVLSLAVARGKAMSIVEEAGGTMASLSCNALEAQSILDLVTDGDVIGKAELACFNGPEAVTISGLEVFVTKAVEIAKERGFFATMLRTRVPVHSSLLDMCSDQYRSLVHNVFIAHPDHNAPKITTYSTLTGDRWDSRFDLDYFWQNARYPVRFAEAVSSILRKAPNATFLEISPHPVLSTYVIELGAREGSVLSVMRRPRELVELYEPQVLLTCLGKLVCGGLASVDFASLNDSRSLDTSSITLPLYPLSRRHIPYMPGSSVLAARQLNGQIGRLIHPNLKMNHLTHPELAQHVIKGEPILPAAGYLEMAFEFGAKQLRDVNFRSMLSLSADNPVAVHVHLDGAYWTVRSDIAGHRLHADGFISKSNTDLDSHENILDLDSIRKRCSEVDTAGFYNSLRYFADYGPAFQRVLSCHKGKNEVLVRVRGKSSDIETIGQYVFHPAILDSCFHVIVHRMVTGNVDEDDYYLPSHIESLHVYDTLLDNGPPDLLYVHAVFRRWHPEYLVFDLAIADGNGQLLCFLNAFKVSRHKSVPKLAIQRRFDLISQPAIPNDTHASAQRIIFDDEELKFQFVHGNEMRLKERLQGVDRNKAHRVWFFSSSNRDGAAARGFTRSLRRELPAWDIRLVLIPEEWDQGRRHNALQSISDSGIMEPETMLSVDGDIHVPRISLSPAPLPPSFNPESLWYLNDKNQLIQTSHPIVPREHILVYIESMSLPDASIRGFVGRTTNDERLELLVMGITGDYTISNYVVTRESYVARVGTDTSGNPELALGALAFSLVFGASSAIQPSRIKGKRILVTDASSPVGRGLRSVLVALDIDHDSVHDSSDISLFLGSSYDIIASGVTRKDQIQVLNSAATSSSSVFLWNDSTYGLRATLHRQAWAAADAISLFCKLKINNLDKGSSPDIVLKSLVDVDTIEIVWHLFDSRKLYLLVGGIGSLGTSIAVWMYENGARRIVLTSRNGSNSPLLIRNENALRMLQYLQDLPDLDLRLESCDAASLVDMKNLTSRINMPIGGCMLLPVVLSDKTFFQHSDDTYKIPFQSKSVAFEVLEEVLEIGELDFLVAFSSVSAFGNAGQTNYSSANTLVEEMTRRYPNAFTMIVPSILDSAIALDPVSKVKHLISWGITSNELCKYIGDGLRKLVDGPFWLYIPDIDWSAAHRNMGPSPLYNHLVEQKRRQEEDRSDEAPLSLRDIVLAHIDVLSEDFSSEVPLTSYGLDSLSAARLSYSLKEWISVTQLQLLANITLRDLEHQLHEQPRGRAINPSNRIGPDFDWTTQHKSGETVVKLRNLEGIPLILVHGVGGSVVFFKPLQERFTTPLWALQTTPETPEHSISATAKFYFEQIRKEQPAGPYRIAGFSGTCLVTFELVHLFEANGDRIVQLSFLDFFPMLFCSPIWTWDADTISQRKASDLLIAQQISVLCSAIRGRASTKRYSIAGDLMDVLNGKEIQPHVKHFLGMLNVLANSVVCFLLDLSGGDVDVLRDSLIKWIREVKTPFTLYVASEGMLAAFSEDERSAWHDFGANVVPGTEVVTIDGDHYEFLESTSFLDSIEKGWKQQ